MNNIDIVAKLGDMKDIDYRNTLVIASLIEVLIDKGIINKNEITVKANYLDSMSIEELKLIKNR